MTIFMRTKRLSSCERLSGFDSYAEHLFTVYICGNEPNIKKQRNGHLQSLLDEIETDRAREESEEIMDINPDSGSKFEKRNEHETLALKGKFSNGQPK
ncbi:hypothetical protein TNCV_2161301 [Trichonephila clavipes]|nr:hypothetical protein TNCV_2161301 [Trichonephila clavipes]